MAANEIAFDSFKLHMFISFDFWNYVYEEQNNIDMVLMGQNESVILVIVMPSHLIHG